MALRKRIAYWLLGIVAVIIALLMALPLLIDSESLQSKVKVIVEQQTGGQLHYQQAELSFLPRPSITLNQIKLDIPEQVQGSVESIQVNPEFWPLLTGQVRLAKLVLDSPEVSLNLSEMDTQEGRETTSLSFSSLQKSLDKGLEPLVKAAPDTTLVVNKGILTINKGEKALSSVKDLELTLDLSIADSGSSQIDLQVSTSALTLHQDGQDIIIKELGLKGGVKKDREKLSLSIDDLTLGKPALKLKGDLIVGSTAPAFELDLHGTGLDVDAIRKTALTLAGDTTPVKEIFNYLRGGTVPQISFHSQGESASELGDLKNIVINGKLQTGAVSIPEIELDLTEVDGDVVVSEGVLEGSKMSTRLEGSSGHDGILKVALAEGNDLFQLELMLSADLPQAQHILKLIVEKSEFAQVVDKVTSLKGTGTGKLVLGDSLTDINARVDMSDMNLTADYQGLPFPVGITKGQLSFAEKQIELKDLSGTFGNSIFSGLSCNIDWTDALHMDLSSGKFGLVLDGLYPWVASFEGKKESLKEIKKVSGRLDLTTLSLKGTVDSIENWQVTGAGSMNDIGIETSRFPTKIELAKGDFTLDAEKLAFQNLKMEGLDANLVLSGFLKGLPQNVDQVELSLDGKMGKDSVAWLRDSLETPETYSLRTPLLFSGTKIVWRPDSATTIKGDMSVDKGPKLTLDIDYRPEQLQVNQLDVKDQHSDAKITLAYGQDELNLNFTGTLQHETLEALFVDQHFGKGQLAGDFNFKNSRAGQAASMANGHLDGADLVIPLPSGHDVAIEKISLDADGPKAQAEATALSWNGFVWSPVKATIAFGQDGISANISEAKLCGIDTTGVSSIVGTEHSLDFTLEGEGLDVASSYSCLTEGQVKMTGTLDFSSKVSSKGQAAELVSNLSGPIEMTFHDGMIEQNKLLARTLAVLNVTEIVKGKLPDLASTGFAYSTITMQGDLQGDKLVISKIKMDGDTLDILGHGEIDFGQDTVDAELLAAPFKTVDTVVKHIPGVNYLLAGSLVAIPVSVKGKKSDPDVRVMSVSSVGSSLLGLGGRVIKSPLKLIETMTPGKDNSKE
jgi:uncharacterized protein involved in outer membrane biogenesis